MTAPVPSDALVEALAKELATMWVDDPVDPEVGDYLSKPFSYTVLTDLWPQIRAEVLKEERERSSAGRSATPDLPGEGERSVEWGVGGDWPDDEIRSEPRLYVIGWISERPDLGDMNAYRLMRRDVTTIRIVGPWVRAIGGTVAVGRKASDD